MEMIEQTVQFTKEVIAEGQKVHWPAKEQLWKATAVTTVVITIISLYMAAVDYLLAFLFRLLER